MYIKNNLLLLLLYAVDDTPVITPLDSNMSHFWWTRTKPWDMVTLTLNKFDHILIFFFFLFIAFVPILNVCFFSKWYFKACRKFCTAQILTYLLNAESGKTKKTADHNILNRSFHSAIYCTPALKFNTTNLTKDFFPELIVTPVESQNRI